MSPLPSTPKPWRFLVPHRASQPSQAPAAPSQFQSTPRFSSSSALRPTDKRRGHDVEDIEEVEDDDSDVTGSSPDTGDGPIVGKRSASGHDSIEPDPDHPTASSPQAEEDPETPDVFPDLDLGEPRYKASPRGPRFLENRHGKRRKLAILDSSPQEEDDPEAREQIDLSEQEQEFYDSDGSQLPDNTAETSLHQPVFQQPPRFKELDAGLESEALPPAFSPQRRGARYVPNGLAAELQGWLSDVKGWEGAERSSPEASARVVVKEVRPGRRMYLVQGLAEDYGSELHRFIFAGEGKLTGLGQRADVSVGSVVLLGRPVWDVLLEGQLWTVACDWSVE